MMKFIRSFLFVAVGLMFSFEGRGSGDRFTEEFNSHLGALRAYVARTGIDSLCFDGSETSSSESVSSIAEVVGRGPSTEEVMAFWGIQRRIERLLEESQPFETFKSVVSSLRSFGEEVKDEAFWKEAVSVYSKTEILAEIKPYDGENHWQAWFKAHLCPSFGTMEDVLGCVLYPVRRATIYCKNEWQYDPFFFYLGAHSADYGNSYARVQVREYVENRRESDEEVGINVMDASDSLALRSPFDKSFHINTDINKLLWAAFTKGLDKYNCADTPRTTKGLIWSEEAEVLRSIKHPTGESLFYLGRCLLNMGMKDEALKVLGQSASFGFKESMHLLSCFEGKGEGIEPCFSDVEIEEIIVYSVYKEVFKINV